MPLLNAAQKVFLGTVPAKSVHKAGKLVWPPGSGNRVNASLALVSGSTVRLSVSWAGAVPTSWKSWISLNGQAWLFWAERTAPGAFDYTTTFNTSVRMRVVAIYPGFDPDIEVFTNTVAIGAAPPPPTRQTTVDCGVLEHASYNSRNERRTDAAGLASSFYGNFDSTHGNQHSQVRFNIPASVRNCISVDRVQVRWWNKHHWFDSGGRVSMVAHHNGSLVTYGGSTGPLLFNGAQANWAGPRGDWISGAEWIDITSLATTGRPTIAEEIRAVGMQGLGLIAAATGKNGYGYAAIDPVLRITYTHYT